MGIHRLRMPQTEIQCPSSRRKSRGACQPPSPTDALVLMGLGPSTYSWAFFIVWEQRVRFFPGKSSNWAKSVTTHFSTLRTWNRWVTLIDSRSIWSFELNCRFECPLESFVTNLSGTCLKLLLTIIGWCQTTAFPCSCQLSSKCWITISCSRNGWSYLPILPLKSIQMLRFK
jgi:hypothetical protein